MRKYIFLFLIFLLPNLIFARSITTIEGKALNYVGQKISVYTIDDYLSRVMTKVASTTVAKDSSFKMSFYNDRTRQLKIQIGKDFIYIYTQPGANYDLYIDGKNPYPSEDAPGVNIQYLFLNLDSTDINYKTLLFDNQQMKFLRKYYNMESTRSITFVQKLDSFKKSIHQQYDSDTSKYFKVFVKYSFASLDDLHYTGERNAYEKYDFYIQPSTVWYLNDRYMDYILHYFDKYEAELSKQEDGKFYKGIIHSSPSMIMNALNDNYTLRNIRLREVVMIDMLSQVYYDNSYPKTNIITILDSLSNYALFAANKEIAKNIKFRLLNLSPGSIIPNFSINVDGKTKMASDYKGKHIYIQFIDKSRLSINDLPLLVKLHQKYNQNIQFLTVMVLDDKDPIWKDPEKFKKKEEISWDLALVKRDDPILKQLNVVKFPYYILIDASTHVVAAPALSPRPNGEYQTIEKDLYEISKHYKAIKEENR